MYLVVSVIPLDEVSVYVVLVKPAKVAESRRWPVRVSDLICQQISLTVRNDCRMRLTVLHPSKASTSTLQHDHLSLAQYWPAALTLL